MSVAEVLIQIHKVVHGVGNRNEQPDFFDQIDFAFVLFYELCKGDFVRVSVGYDSETILLYYVADVHLDVDFPDPPPFFYFVRNLSENEWAYILQANQPGFDLAVRGLESENYAKLSVCPQVALAQPIFAGRKNNVNLKVQVLQAGIFESEFSIPSVELFTRHHLL